MTWGMGGLDSNLSDLVDVVYIEAMRSTEHPRHTTRWTLSAIGELETLILLAILRVGDRAYGVSVQRELAERTGRRLTRGAIYTALRRLEAKGFVDGALGEATPSRGGRAKRLLFLTPEGKAALQSATRDLDRMRSGLDDVLVDA